MVQSVAHNFDVTITHCVLLMLSLNTAAAMELYHVGNLHLPGILSLPSPSSSNFLISQKSLSVPTYTC